MNALNTLSQKNGLKTTNTVLGKQQSGVDAAQKANPQENAAQMNMNTAQAMLHGKENTLTPPKDAHEQAVRMNQQTAEGMLNGEIPIVKKEDKKPEQPKQMSYADMFKIIYGNGGETEEQKARREKRERRNATIAAIGDGLRALSNMYFATKGAKVVHDPNSDMTPIMQKRKQMMEQQREKNKSAWLNGYLKAQTLDEERRKNDATLNENKRWHDFLKEKYDRSGDQGDRKLDLQEVYYNARVQNMADQLEEKTRSNKANENIKQQNANTSASRAAKAGSGGGRGGSSTQYAKACQDALNEWAQRDPKNAEKLAIAVANTTRRQLDTNNAVGIYNYLLGGGTNKTSSSRGKSGSKGKAASKGGGSSKGGKVTIKGVNWVK